MARASIIRLGGLALFGVLVLAACGGGNDGGGNAAPPDFVRFAYVANGASDSVSAFRIDSGTGALVQIDCDPATGGVQECPAGANPYSVAADPAGKFAYVANSTGNSISVYAIDSGTGVLARIDCDSGTAGIQDCPASAGPVSVAVHPGGQFAYAVNYGSSGSVSVFGIDAGTGLLTRVDCDPAVGGVQDCPAGAGPQSIAVHPSGQFAYVGYYGYGATVGASVSAYSIDTVTGALTRIDCDPVTAGDQDCPATGLRPAQVAVDPGGKFAYAVNGDATTPEISVYGINSGTGVLTPIDCDPGAGGLQGCTGGTLLSGITAHPNGKFVYVSGGSKVGVYGIDTTTGVLTRIDCDAAIAGAQDCSAGPNTVSVAVDPRGEFAYAVNFNTNGSVSAYRIDASTGVLHKIDCVPTSTTACNGTDFLTGGSPHAISVVSGK